MTKREEDFYVEVLSRMTCGNCKHWQRDKHCALYPKGSTTEHDSVATLQQYCDWESAKSK